MVYRSRWQLGFTLLEFVFTILLVGIISVVVGRILYQGYNDMMMSENISNADWQGLIALDRITNDIHTIRSSADVTTISSTQLAFVDINGNTVTLQYSGSTITRNGLTLATGVTDFSFGYLDNTGATTSSPASVRYITINMTVTQGTMTLGMSTVAGTRGMT